MLSNIPQLSPVAKTNGILGNFEKVVECLFIYLFDCLLVYIPEGSCKEQSLHS